MIYIHFDSEMKKMIMSSITLEWFSSTQYCITVHTAKNIFNIVELMDNGHPERAFFQKFETFGLGQTNWAEILGGTLAISSQTISTILAL